MDHPPPARPEGYVFIVSYGRSGSTLLQSVLNSQPGYQIRGENHNALFQIFQASRMIAQGQDLSNVLRNRISTTPNHPWYGIEQVNPAEFAQGLVQAFITHVLRPDPGTRISGFKEIRFDQAGDLFAPYLDFIRAHFPRARFVLNSRDVARTARSGWWAGMDTAEVTALLRDCDQRFDAYQAAHPKDCFRVHYDDYTADPTRFRDLFAFLGEPYDPDAVAQVLNRRLTH